MSIRWASFTTFLLLLRVEDVAPGTLDASSLAEVLHRVFQNIFECALTDSFCTLQAEHKCQKYSELAETNINAIILSIYLRSCSAIV